MADNTTKIVISAEDRASGPLRTINTQFDGMTGKVSGLQSAIVGLGGALAGLSIVNSISSAIGNADDMGKLAQKTGLTTEALSKLSYASKLSDVSNEQLATGLKQLSKNMTEAASGSGEAVKYFTALGVSVTDGAGKLKSADTVMGELAGKFSGMQDGATKTATAMAIFGKSGSDLIPLLNSGSDGLRDMADEAVRLGVVMTDEMSASAQEFNDNLTRMRAASEGLSISLANQMLPGLTQVSRAMTDAAREGSILKTIWVGLGGLGAALFTDEFASAPTKIKNLQQSISDMQRHLPEVQQGGYLQKWLYGSESELKEKIAASQKEIAALEKQMTEASAAGDKAVKEKSEAAKKAAEETEARLRAILSAGGTAAKEKESEYAKLNAQISERIAMTDAELKSTEKLTEGEKLSAKVMDDIVNGRIKLTESQKKSIESSLDELVVKQKSVVEQTKQREGVKKLAEEETRRNTTLREQVSKDRESLEGMRIKSDLLERGIDSQYEYNVALLEAKLASIDFADATLEEVQVLEERLDLAKQIAKEEKRGTAAKDAQKAARDSAEAAQREWEKASDEINRGLTDALMRGFESGKDFASNFKDSLVNMFKTLVLRPVISAVLSPVSGAISAGMGSLGIPGASNAAGVGNTLSAANSAYSLYSSAMIPGGAVAGAGLYSAGSALGSASMMGYGAGVEAASLGAIGGGGASVVGAVGAEGSAAFAAGSGAAGTGLTGALASVPVWGWVAAAAALMFMSDSDPTPPSGLLATLKPDQSNLPDFRFDRKSGAFSDGAYSESPFGQIGATEAFAYSGESAQKYLDMIASLDKTLATYLSPDSVSKVAGELQLKTYGSSGEGWLETALPNMIRDRFKATFEEVNPSLEKFLDGFKGSSEEIIVFGGSLLEIDKKLHDTSASTRLFGETLDWTRIEDAAQSGENVVQTFQRLQSEFELTNQIADMMGKNSVSAFGAVGLASEGARASLIEAAGGLDALSAKTGAFFQQYYTDSERQQASARYSLAIVNDGFAKLGITVPSTMGEFRKLAEAQDLSTDAGRTTYLALMDLSGAFAAVSAAGGAAAVSLGQSAEMARQAIVTANQSTGGIYTNNNRIAIDGTNAQASYEQALSEVNAMSAANVSGTQIMFGNNSDQKLNQEVASWLSNYRIGGYTAPGSDQVAILRNLGLIPSHATGLDRVPYDNYLANLHAGEMVIDPATSESLRRYGIPAANDEVNFRPLRTGGNGVDISALIAELQQLRQDLSEAQYAIAKNTGATARQLERWDGDGMPEVRAVA
ncbi:MAG: hypothetical protein K8H84_11005 [Sulfuricella denitrificans]|nr:hypothetical protein [Sulfuricella denitrificans]